MTAGQPAGKTAGQFAGAADTDGREDAAGDGAERIRATARRAMAAGQSSPRLARDPVNLPMIRNWVEAIGDQNPVYTDAEFAAASVHGGLVAPPAMAQVWTMPGLHAARAGDDPTGQMTRALDQAGYTSVVATNCDQVYHRYLRIGEQVTVRTELIDLAGPKQTALGEGWFFTTRSTWYSAGDQVATMDFRILKFRPPVAGQAGSGRPDPPRSAAGQVAAVLRPPVSPDTAFFWAGTAIGELRIQRCGGCGALRHPPGPMCPECGAAEPGYVVAAGPGTVFSYVVHHHPPVPGKRLPIVIALVELDEGVRVLGELLGARPDQVRIGMPVTADFIRIDDQLVLPAWRPVTPAGLPPLVIDASTTFVISTALATRDFTDVHHDTERAVERGSEGIFLNILTSTGLVQRYVSAWAGPDAVLREISIRLGAPCYAGDTLTFSGDVIERDGGRCRIRVTGRCGLGEHVTGTVLADLPDGRA
jgi:hypothetical protein